MSLPAKRRQLFLAASFLFVATLPFSIVVNNIATGVLLMAWILHSTFQEKIKQLKNNTSGYWIFVLFVVYGISLLYSKNLGDGLTKLETKLSLIGIALAVFSSNLKKEEVKKVLRVFTFANLVIGMGLVLLALVRYLKDKNGNTFFYHELTSPLGLHAIYFAIYVCIGIFILLLDDSINVYLKTLLVLISLWLIVMLSALMVIGFLILAFGCGLIIFLYDRKGAWSAVAVSTTALVVITLLVLLVPRTREKIKQINGFEYRMDDPDYSWNTVTLRLAMWTCALPVTLEKPFLGVGVGDENDALQISYSRYNFKEGIRCNYNTHNQYLSTCIAIGFVGVTILLGMICVPAIKAFHQNDWLAFAFLSLIGFSFLTENILSVQKGVVFFSFFYSLLLKKDIISHS